MIVRMESRGGEEHHVKDPADARFLRAADRFQMKCTRILQVPWYVRAWQRIRYYLP